MYVLRVMNMQYEKIQWKIIKEQSYALVNIFFLIIAKAHRKVCIAVNQIINPGKVYQKKFYYIFVVNKNYQYCFTHTCEIQNINYE